MPLEVGEAGLADGVSAAEADGQPDLDLEAIGADGTAQVLCPLRGLDRHITSLSGCCRRPIVLRHITHSFALKNQSRIEVDGTVAPLHLACASRFGQYTTHLQELQGTVIK